MRVTLVGLGGIGTAILPHLARYLAHQYTEEDVTLLLVDGDSYEPRNRCRQAFSTFGNKAQVWATDLARDYPRLHIEAIPEYVTRENLSWIIEKRSVVFLAVDNHATRKLVSNFAERLSDIVLISGGNELTDGSVQIFVRKRGRNMTLPMTAYHPEIASAPDQMQKTQSCEIQVQSDPQLLFMNLAIASAMLNAFWAWEQKGLTYGEVFVDIQQARMQPHPRWARKEKPEN